MSKRNRVDRVPFELGSASGLTRGWCFCGESEFFFLYSG